MRSLLLSFIFVLLLITELYAQTLPIEVNYFNRDITVDGKYNDWSLQDTLVFRFTRQEEIYNNRCIVTMGWDDLYLYGLFIVYDKHLIALEPANAFNRLHYNDGAEFYIDSGNDSRDTMDLNDYQFLIDVRGANVIFKGDRLDLERKFLVPKEYGTANIIFQCAVQRWGTLNRMNDKDSMYCVEFAIPWTSIGIRPVQGISFKVDFCVNDNDTLVNFRDLPPGPVDHYSFMSITGSRDFGFPRNWVPVKLRGEPSLLTRLTNKYSHEWIYLFFSTFLVTIFIIVFFFYRIRRLQRIPQKTELTSTPLLSAILQNHNGDGEKQENPLITRARNYIRNHIEEPLKPEKLASEMNVSLRNLQRIFSNELQTTPGNFILLLKMEKAAEWLTEGKRSVSEVAYDLGFNDPAYFSRAFKKYFGKSPKEVRLR